MTKKSKDRFQELLHKAIKPSTKECEHEKIYRKTFICVDCNLKVPWPQQKMGNP